MPVGPIVIDVPDGWQVTRSGSDDLQMADGTAGRVTGQERGTATAVFDIYLDSPFTTESFLEERLAGDADSVSVDSETIDGRTVTFIDYRGDAFAGRQMAVLIPEHRIQIVYRAADPHDDTAFARGLPAFKAAVRSIRFTEPADRA